MNPVLAGFIGVLFGAVAGGALVAVLTRRHLRRARAHERRARAHERLAEMGSMAGGLAHEIKNPLSTIGLNVELLEEAIDELEVPEDRRQPLNRRFQTLAREVDRLRGILSDFLDYAGGLHLRPVRQDVNVIVDELIDFFAPQAAQSGIRVRPMLAPTKLEAAFDAQHVKQALLNLMLNAVQAMAGSHGDLIIRTESVTEPDGTQAVAIHVTDTGPGMDAAVRENIFRPYFTTKSGGSGLGMPTARRLIEAHGGRIDIFSEPGKGTDVCVILPCTPIDEEGSEPNATQTP